MPVSVYIIIVTHNSSDVLPVCLSHLAKQTIPITSIIIVDSGSSDTGYLLDLPQSKTLKCIYAENIGFSKANNLGFRAIDEREGVVLFINPDTFLPADFLLRAIEILREYSDAAVVSGKLLSFDISKQQETGKIDSTGIYRKWYGRWYDRGTGEDNGGQYNVINQVPAICGALMVCKMEALSTYNDEIFDSDFFLYKEDIELCLRLRRDGWKLIYDPRLVAYHCRGWHKKRNKIPFALRLISAKNEVMLYKKHPSPYILWAYLKYFLVSVCHL